VADITQGSIQISADPSAVARVLADVRSYPAWTEGMSNIEILEESDGRPIRASFRVSGGPISDEVELSYVWTASDVKWTLLKGNTITRMNGSYSWLPATGGTEVTYTLEIELSMSLPGFIKRAAEKTIVTTALQGLKKRVESAND
jgi:ribosome-associated toxin RatA of RatAB toxin-antitoxin module